MIALEIECENYLAIIGGSGPSSNDIPLQPGAQYSGKGLLSGFQQCNEIHLYSLNNGQYCVMINAAYTHFIEVLKECNLCVVITHYLSCL